METGGVNRGSLHRISVYPRCVGILAKKQQHIIAACGIDSYTETTAELKSSKHVMKALSMKQYELPFLLACCTANWIIRNSRKGNNLKSFVQSYFQCNLWHLCLFANISYFLVLLRDIDSSSYTAALLHKKPDSELYLCISNLGHFF